MVDDMCEHGFDYSHPPRVHVAPLVRVDFLGHFHGPGLLLRFGRDEQRFELRLPVQASVMIDTRPAIENRRRVLVSPVSVKKNVPFSALPFFPGIYLHHQ